MDFLSTAAAIAQILGTVWLLLLGSKTIMDIIRDVSKGRPFPGVFNGLWNSSHFNTRLLLIVNLILTVAVLFLAFSLVETRSELIIIKKEDQPTATPLVASTVLVTSTPTPTSAPTPTPTSAIITITENLQIPCVQCEYPIGLELLSIDINRNDNTSAFHFKVTDNFSSELGESFSKLSLQDDNGNTYNAGGGDLNDIGPGNSVIVVHIFPLALKRGVHYTMSVMLGGTGSAVYKDQPITVFN